GEVRRGRDAEDRMARLSLPGRGIDERGARRPGGPGTRKVLGVPRPALPEPILAGGFLGREPGRARPGGRAGRRKVRGESGVRGTPSGRNGSIYGGPEERHKRHPDLRHQRSDPGRRAAGRGLRAGNRRGVAGGTRWL
ncbi:MAG: Periplasmic thiol:disulfide interchange protein DsbA, partial [uncultured Rubrobacteraceae bacterium]